MWPSRAVLVNRLGAAKRAGRLDDELERLGRIPLLIADEVGYIPFDGGAAARFVALISHPTSGAFSS